MLKFVIFYVVLVCVAILDADACGPDEDYVKCGPFCEPTCANRENIKIACVAACVEGCYCKAGLLRNIDGRCVLSFECFNKEEYACPINEYFSTCAQPRRCLTCANPRVCGISSCEGDCICVGGYLRAANGTCIPQEQCPNLNGIHAPRVKNIMLVEHIGSTSNIKTNDIDKGYVNLGKQKGPIDQEVRKISRGELPLASHENTPETETNGLAVASHKRVPETKTKGSPLANHKGASEIKSEESALTSHKKVPEAKTKESPLASHKIVPEIKTEEFALTSHKRIPETKTKEYPLSVHEVDSSRLPSSLITRTLFRKVFEKAKSDPTQKQNDEEYVKKEN